MKIAGSKGLLILVTFSLVVSIFSSVGTIGVVQASGPTYIPHSTIHIDNNNDLLSLRAAGGCTGSGTANDPYVINGYDISGTGGACIYVANITVRLVISNSYLHGNNYGIEVIRSNYVTVTNNNCSGNDPYGIWLRSTGNDTVTNNVCIDAAHGIYTSAAYDNIINNNTCRATRACAVMLDKDSNRNVISNNTCYSSGDNGIYVLHSDRNTISNNTLKNNKGHGIHLADSDFNNLYGNVLIVNNKSTSVYNALHQQCADTGVGNHWNTGSYGNYWSDWTTPDANADGIIDRPYPIGEGSSKDYYPLASINVPGPTIPGVPTGLIATAGNGQVGLVWSAPSSNGGAAIDYYIVYQGGADVKHISGTTYTVAGLANGHSYSFTVAAHNPAGTGAQTSSVSSTPISVPNVPTGLTAIAGNGQVALNWTAPSFNGGTAIDHYIVYQGGIDVAHVASTSTTITGLVNGQSYSFAVSAHGSAGIGTQSSPVVSIPFTVPGVPTGLKAIAGTGRVSLNWTAPSSNGGTAIDYYVIYQDGADVKHASSTSYTVAGLTGGQSYSFKVTAHNAAGTGAQTSTVSSTPVNVPSITLGWGTAKLLETGSGDASTPQVAVGTDGNAMVVWQQYDGTYYNIYASSYSSGAWGTVTLIETISGSADSPQIAMDNNGNAVAVWRQYDGAYYSIYANTYAAGAWGTAQLLETATGDAKTPQVAMDNNGNAVAVWGQYDGAYYSTYANRYTAGAWGAAKLIETAKGDAQIPQVAMDNNGNAIVVWVQLDNVWRLSIYASKYTNAIGWGTTQLLETSNVDAGSPQVAMDNNGNAIVVWVQAGMIYADRYSAGAWGTAQPIKTSTVWGSSPQVAMDNNGNAVAIWAQGGSIYANRYSAGAWGTAKLLNTSAGWAMTPQVAMDNNGNAVAIWAQGGSIYANRYSAGAWGTAKLIETGAKDAFVPQVAMDGSGNALAVWQQNDGSHLSIYGNTYGANA
ncbi:MAG TPA: NosD domain-containing protein [Methanomassiliicoccales archaeon]|jgi:parallel beta-helix repeat protein